MELYIVTGCTSGLGLALHNQLVKENKKIHCIFLGRDIKRIEQSSNSTYVEFDFTIDGGPDIHEYFDNYKFSRATLISNAGTINPIGNTANLDSNLFQKSVSVNFMTPALLTIPLISWSIKNKIALRIANISSGAALRAIKGWAGYCSTKAAIRMFLDVAEIENDNVEVFHIDPGVMDTVMQKTIRESNPLDMPDVDNFINFKLDHKLKSVSEVASSILDKLKV